MVDCPICNESEWENIDEFRDIAKGMHICKKCGFVTYPEIVSNKKKLEDYYEEDYRKPPAYGSLVTGQKKLFYHADFLKDILHKWKEEGKKPVFGEVGAAYGMFLNWLKQVFPESDVYGTELTRSYVKNAWYEYGIKLEKELNKDVKYDMITSYKVLEHQIDPDKELLKYHEMLKDDGFLYISVPCWFEELHNFGTNGFDIEYYYHTNHINAWTKKNFEALIAKTGWEIVKFNETIYDQTYLLKKTDPKKELDFDTYENVKTKVNAVKKASDSLKNKDFEGAILAYPEFPYAVSGLYEFKRKELHEKGWDAIKGFIDNARECCPRSAHIVFFSADIHMRYNKWEEGIELLNKALKMRPNDAQFLFAQMNGFIALAEDIPEKRNELLHAARKVAVYLRETNEGARQNAITQIYAINSMLNEID